MVPRRLGEKVDTWEEREKQERLGFLLPSLHGLTVFLFVSQTEATMADNLTEDGEKALILTWMKEHRW